MFGCLGASCAPIAAEHAQGEENGVASTFHKPPAASLASRESDPAPEFCGHDGLLLLCRDEE
jgi:hypothetical protein